jgi:hypothetical protein
VGNPIREFTTMAGCCRESLDKIQGRAFTGQQGTGRALQTKKSLSGYQALPLSGQEADLNTGIQLAKNFPNPGAAAKNTFLARDDSGLTETILRYQLRCNVT